jgi:hypothetical protein
MDTILIACETISDEIEGALDFLGLNYEIRWLEGGLHNSPERLRLRMRQVLDEADGACDRLLVALGYCGGGLSGLTTGNYETVLPMTDDCLTLLLGSMKARREASRPVTYFLTEGWLRHENNLVGSYENAKKKFSPKIADMVNRSMLEGYSRLGLLDTKSYDLEKVVELVTPMAEDLNLSVETLPVDFSWLFDFLRGDHDDASHFLKVPPRSTIDFTLWNKLLGGII